MEKLKIKISQIENLEEAYCGSESFQCPGLENIVKKQDLKASYVLKKLQDEILLSSSLAGKITVGCCRCLNDFNYPINLEFQKLYPETSDEINLAEELRQLLILNLPDKPLCRETCAGLCQKCGKDLNKSKCKCTFEYTDPRWDKLKKLIKD